MSRSDEDEAPSRGAGLSIGALSRASGVPIATLRTWESRYGYPRPDRRDSGHRVYPVESVTRLRRIAEAIARGHRASCVLTASDADLLALLDCDRTSPAQPAVAGIRAIDQRALLDAVRAFDGSAVCGFLTAQWSRLGLLPFLEECLVPLLQEVGERWARGDLAIRHEHFLSQRLEDLLRALRHPYEERAAGPMVVLATLPGELHGIGLQMAALTLSVSGCRTCMLGTDTPVEQIADLTRDLGARAVAISLSEVGSPRRNRDYVRLLRAAVPRRTSLLVGGRGAPGGVERVTVLAGFADLANWASTVNGAAA